MQYEQAIFENPVDLAVRIQPDEPVACFCPRELQTTYHRFTQAFDGLVTYAVKANASRVVLENLSAMGMKAFDVASPAEMKAVRDVSSDAVLHYHNPVRSTSEIAKARALGVQVWSVDSAEELAKIAPDARDEVSVRLALPVDGAAYDFGTKFGTNIENCAQLLRCIDALGARASLTFHPGTQCDDPAAWEAYIRAAGHVAQAADVQLYRLNVGGGFAANRDGYHVDIEGMIERINKCVRAVFPTPPKLVCEPGRALVSEAFTLITRVKALRANGDVFLNDGIYGGLAEMRDMPTPRRFAVVTPAGTARSGELKPRTVFGPTCDSVDRLPGQMPLPSDLSEGDFVLFPAMGAYSQALSTAFNGYGVTRVLTVASGVAEAGQRRINP